MTNPRCNRCLKRKPRSAFATNRTRFNGLQAECRACSKERYEARRDAMTEEQREAERAAARERARNLPWNISRRRLTMYHVTPEQFDQILADQGGLCAGCGTDTPGGRRGTWHLDHDHSCCPRSGRSCGFCVRGVLCNNCNMGIGFLADDPERLRRLAHYLEDYEALKRAAMK